MQHQYDYLIIGAGMTAANAVHGIRERDPHGSIGILGEESDPPATRPALSKKLWTDPAFVLDKIWIPTGDATVHTHTRVTQLDRKEHRAHAEDGTTFIYGKLLLATGGHPRTIDLPASERVLYFRTVEDYRHLRALSQRHRPHIAVIGGSFIGTELAAALVQNDCKVTLIFPERILGSRMFPNTLAMHFHDTYEAEGINLMPGRHVVQGFESDDDVQLILDDGSELNVDGVAIGLGITPATTLAEEAGLQVKEGIVVDAQLRTQDPDIYAAGDVAHYPDSRLGLTRVEHVDNANEMGQCVGRIMAGAEERYTHTPYFYSNVFDFSYQAVGQVSTQRECIEHWVTPGRQGMVFYVDNERVKGVLLLNLNDTDKALEYARATLNTSDTSRPELLLS